MTEKYLKTICLCAGGNRVYVSVNNKRNHGYYPTPHPFLLVDTIEELVPGVRAAGKNV